MVVKSRGVQQHIVRILLKGTIVMNKIKCQKQIYSIINYHNSTDPS